MGEKKKPWITISRVFPGILHRLVTFLFAKQVPSRNCSLGMSLQTLTPSRAYSLFLFGLLD
jgi:hypothetical protein